MTEVEDTPGRPYEARCIHCGQALVAPHIEEANGRQYVEDRGWYYAEGRFVWGWVCPNHAPLYREAIE